MLTYTFEERGEKPYYQYLYEVLKEDIEEGRLKEGEHLPSKRAFAKQLGLSVMTIASAYEQLLVEGYIYAVEKKGYYVAAVQPYLTEPLQEDPAVKIFIEGDDASREETKANWRMDFASNHVDRERFPMSTWSHLMRAVLSGQSKDVLLPSPPQGVYELRQAIADHLYHFRGMRILPEQIVIGAGTEYLYHLLIQLLGRDHVYGIENPGYQKLAKIYAHNGVDYRYVDLDAHGLSMESLRKQKVEIIHTSPTHHFPTGIAMPISRRQKLLAWAAEKEGRYIIEDDYDCEFRFGGLPIPTLQSIDGAGRVIYLNTFSKSLTPSIRISYMVLPRTLVGKFQENLGFYACTVSNFEQYTLAAFLQQGYFEKHINRMRNFYKNHRNQVIAKLKESRLWQMASIYEEDAGLHFLLHIDTQKEDSVIKDQLQQRGIRLRGMSDYTYDGSQVIPHTFIINYTAIDPQDLPEVLEEIYQVCIN